jgi:type I restriction enzyme, R subunit
MISYTTPIAESDDFFVLDQYTKSRLFIEPNLSEYDLESEFITDLKSLDYENFCNVNTSEKLLANMLAQLQILNGVLFLTLKANKT